MKTIQLSLKVIVDVRKKTFVAYNNTLWNIEIRLEKSWQENLPSSLNKECVESLGSCIAMKYKKMHVESD